MTSVRPCCLLGLLLLAPPIAAGQQVGKPDELDEAIAEAIRLDPGWNYPDLLEQRRRGRMPDAANGAVQARRALTALPEGWDRAPDGQAATTLGPKDEPRGRQLVDNLGRFAPNQRLTAAFEAGLKAQVDAIRPGIVAGRKLMEIPDGQTDFRPGLNPIETPLDYAQGIRGLARALQLDAYARAQAGDLDGAIGSVVAMVHLARSLGDEPTQMSQLVRMAIDTVSLATLQRVMAQGQATDEALAKLQGALLREADAPRTLYALRGERAMLNDLFWKLETAQLRPSDLRFNDGDKVGEVITRLVEARPAGDPRLAYLRHNHAVSLKLATAAVENVKGPHETWRRGWDAWNTRVKAYDDESRTGDRSHAMALILLPGLDVAANADLRVTTLLRAAAAAAATERFRRETGRWPAKLDEVVPKYLAQWPTDPYSGKPLKIARGPDGLTVYGLGEDGEDGRGRLSPRGLSEAPFDVGFPLFNPEERARPTAELPPPTR